MIAFPKTAVAPQVFFEELIPALFAELTLDDNARMIVLRVGVVLTSDGDGGGGGGEGPGQGGEWTLSFADGELAVSAGRANDCDLTIVQRVSDWRSALWEARPRLIADIVARIVSSGPEALPSSGFGGEGIDHPATLKGLSDLQGLIEAVIADEDDSTDTEGWKVGVHLGPGQIPESPQATVRLGAEQAEAMRRGELHPIEALITGQLRLEGDLGLIIQLQAVAMQVSGPPPTRG